MTEQCSLEDIKTLSYLCKEGLDTCHPEPEEDMIGRTPNIAFKSEQKKDIFFSLLFTLMTKKHESQEPTNNIQFFVGCIQKTESELRNKLLELTWKITEQNFENEESKSEETNRKIEELSRENIFRFDTNGHRIG